jgi:hypothetical protein
VYRDGKIDLIVRFNIRASDVAPHLMPLPHRQNTWRAGVPWVRFNPNGEAEVGTFST